MTRSIEQTKPIDPVGWLNYQATFETTTYKGFMDYWTRFTKLKPGIDITPEDYKKLRGAFRDSLETAARSGGINVHNTQELKNLVTYGLLPKNLLTPFTQQIEAYQKAVQINPDLYPGGVDGVYQGILGLTSDGVFTLKNGSMGFASLASDTDLRISFPIAAEQIRRNIDNYKTKQEILAQVGQNEDLQMQVASLRQVHIAKRTETQKNTIDSLPIALLPVKKGQKYVGLSVEEVKKTKTLLNQCSFSDECMNRDVLDVAVLQEKLLDQPAAQKYQTDYPNAKWVDGKFGKATFTALQEYVNLAHVLKDFPTA